MMTVHTFSIKQSLKSETDHVVAVLAEKKTQRTYLQDRINTATVPRGS